MPIVDEIPTQNSTNWHTHEDIKYLPVILQNANTA